MQRLKLRKQPLRSLSLEELPDLFDHVRNEAEVIIKNRPPAPTLDEETERLWIEALAMYGITPEKALELLTEVPKIMELARLARLVSAN
jgi:hypothetical protein